MKYRLQFVSNSSSTSFLIATDLSKEEILEQYKKDFDEQKDAIMDRYLQDNKFIVEGLLSSSSLAKAMAECFIENLEDLRKTHPTETEILAYFEDKSYDNLVESDYLAAITKKNIWVVDFCDNGVEDGEFMNSVMMPLNDRAPDIIVGEQSY